MRLRQVIAVATATSAVLLPAAGTAPAAGLAGAAQAAGARIATST